MADICEKVPRPLRGTLHQTLERLEQLAETVPRYIRAVHHRPPAAVAQDAVRERALASTEARLTAFHQAVVDQCLPPPRGSPLPARDHRQWVRKEQQSDG